MRSTLRLLSSRSGMKEDSLEEVVEEETSFHVNFRTKMSEKLRHVFSVIVPQVLGEIGDRIYLLCPMNQGLLIFLSADLTPSLGTEIIYTLLANSVLTVATCPQKSSHSGVLTRLSTSI